MLPLLLSFVCASAIAQDLGFGFTPAPGPGENPALLITPTRTVTNLYVQINVGGKTLEFTKKNISAGTQARFEWPRNTAITHADAFVRASFTDGAVEEQNVPIDYQYKAPLAIDLSHATADLEKKTVTVRVSTPIKEAEIVAYGAHKAELDRRVVSIDGGPGDVAIPFIGDPAEIVLLDMTLKTANAWAGFTYSPWFLDIPHDDVLFASDSDVIAADEEWKLNKTMEQLTDVSDKYGSIVPVKLYIAGCTDTQGDASHNSARSQRRALAIARWIKAHGFGYPIFYHGFGDGVDMQVNRRALYMVGANPPPAGSGVPGVGWSALK